MLRIVEESARSDTGRQRRTNEDAFFARAPVFAVADGMGGAQAGEIAAAIAADSFERRPADAGSDEQMLRVVAESANRKIWELAHKDPERSGMGTTLTAAVVGDEEISIAHVGDSRAYRLRDGQLTLLTRDHSLVEELKRQGTISEQEAENHPQRSIITRALGPEPDVEVDTQTHSVRNGDTFMLCSDGLTSMIPDEAIRETLASSPSLDEATASLIAQANEQGGRDNITVVTFRLGAVGEEGVEDQHTMVGVKSPLADSEQAVSEGTDAGVASGTVAAGGDIHVSERGEAGPARNERAAGAARPARRRRRRPIKLVALAVVVVALIVGGFVGMRQVYFVGTDSNGLVSVYRGLPYDLPAGIELYSEEYVSPIPAEDIRPFRRQRLLDHELRSRSDALDLVQSLEAQR